LYKNGDSALSAANMVFGSRPVTVTQTGYVWNKPLPPAGSPYVWRVRKIDPSNNPGPWSAVTGTEPGSEPTVPSIA
jgi:hypothetical protein